MVAAPSRGAQRVFQARALEWYEATNVRKLATSSTPWHGTHLQESSFDAAERLLRAARGYQSAAMAPPLQALVAPALAISIECA